MSNYDGFNEKVKGLFISLLPSYLGGPHERLGDKIKGDGTPVGSLDHLALARLRELVREYFPSDDTIGEEDNAGTKSPNKGESPEWDIDGLDGTGNRRMGLNSYGAAIVRRQGDKVLYSAIFRPIDQALRGNGFFYAEHGGGAWQWCDEHRCYHQLHTAEEGQLERITVMVEGSSKKFFKSAQICGLGKSLTVRPGFSSCIAATAVALGNASAFVSVDNAPWDNLPAALFIEEAGGKVTDWDGNALTFATSRNIIAAGNAADHEAILMAMKGKP